MTKKKLHKRTLEDRFWSKVDIREPDKCWEWQASLQKGYGQISVPWQSWPCQAHRASWVINYGPIPEAMAVCHKCDNPKCVNPSHLFLGTQFENLEDMTRKGRRKHGIKPQDGESNDMAKLTREDVKRIRTLRKSGKRISEISAIFPIVTYSNIKAIVYGKTWKGVK